MKNRWLATLALATACAAPLLVHAGTTKSEWKETLDCAVYTLSLIHISEPTRRRGISYAVFCL